MKKFISAAIISVYLSGFACANELSNIAGKGYKNERQAVLEVLEMYLSVTDDKYQAAIRKSFHPKAYLMSVSGKGALRALTQDFWWERVSQIPADQKPRTSSILLIDVSGHAAVARIDITNGGDGSISTDYFNLLKVGNEWKIVNKTLSTPI